MRLSSHIVAIRLAGPLATIACAVSAATSTPATSAPLEPTSAAWLRLLPDGETKRRFILDCTGCHVFDAQFVREEGRVRTHAEWQEAIERMLRYAGATTGFPVISSSVDPKVMSEWLVANLAKDPAAEPATPPAPEVTEFLLPEPQDLAHDVAVDARGRVIVTGMMTHRMYVLDPAAARASFEPVDIPVPKANPRAVEIDAQGNWWVVLGMPQKLARYAPKSRQWASWDVGVYPHSVALGADGAAWYNGHFTRAPEIIGRVVAATGAVEPITLPEHPKLAADPGGPIPYEIRVAPDGRVWLSELQGNRLVAYDPKSKRSETFDMPTSYSGPRRFDVDANGKLWIPSYTTNELVRLDPSTHVFTAHRLPVADAVRTSLGSIPTRGSSGSGLRRATPSSPSTRPSRNSKRTGCRATVRSCATWPSLRARIRCGSPTAARPASPRASRVWCPARPAVLPRGRGEARSETGGAGAPAMVCYPSRQAGRAATNPRRTPTLNPHRLSTRARALPVLACWLALSVIAAVALPARGERAAPARDSTTSNPDGVRGRYGIDREAARNALAVWCKHALARPRPATRLFVEAYFMRGLVAAHDAFASSPAMAPDSIDTQAGVARAIAFADSLVTHQNKFGYWSIGYQDIWFADMAAAVALFPALEPYIEEERLVRYRRTAGRFLKRLEAEGMLLDSGAVGLGQPGIVRFGRREPFRKDPYLVSTALVGLEVQSWLYLRTGNVACRERALRSLEYTLSQITRDGFAEPISREEGVLRVAAYVQEGWMAIDRYLDDPQVLQRLRARLPRHVAWLLRTQRPDGTWDGGFEGEFARTPGIIDFLIWYDQRCESRADVRRAVRRASASLIDPESGPKHGLYREGEHHEVLTALAGRPLVALVTEKFVP